MVMVLGAVLFDCYGIGVFEFAVTCFDFVFSFLIYHKYARIPQLCDKLGSVICYILNKSYVSAVL